MPIHSTNDYLEKGIKKKDWVAIEMGHFRFKKLIARYNQMRLHNDSERFTSDQWLELAKTFRPKYAKDNPMGAVSKTKALLSKQEVRTYADSLLAEALGNANIDVNFVVNKRKDILEKAIENKQLNVANQTLDVIEDYMGMKTITTKETSIEDEREIDYIKLDEEIDNPKALEEKKKELLENTTENPALLTSS